MNKGLHRIIFNKKHGTMVAVAETANSRGKGKQAGSSAPLAAGVSDGLCFKLKTALKTMVCTLVSAGMILPAHAQITVDKTAPKNQQAVILKTNTGAPLVNIQTPNARGLSHNRYTQFDVDTKGAVLNNDRNGNPFLAKGSAQLILNEVRGAASKLNGIITVGGQKADVIIANPNGITVNGGGFKNVGRGILTTGTPQIGKDGALTGFDVRQGTLTVGAAGWNDKGGADYTEVLARAVALQGKLQGKNLAVSTGAQKVDYASGEISAGTAAGSKPAVALDTAALGGMYADSITIIANEKGVGVKNAGTLEAAGQLVVTSAGRIENKGRIATTAAGTAASPAYLGIETTEAGSSGAIVSKGGRIESKGLTVIDAAEDLLLDNTKLTQSNTASKAAVMLDSGRKLVITNNSSIDNKGGGISASAQDSTINAGIEAAGGIYASSTGNTVIQAQGRLKARDDLTVLANGSISHQGAAESVRGTVHLEAAKPFLPGSGASTSDIAVSGSVKSAKHTAVLADGNITAKTSALKVSDGLYLHAGKSLNLTADADFTAKNISLKAGGGANIKGSGKTVGALQNIDTEAHSVAVDNAHLNARSGRLNITAHKGGITLKNTKLNAARDLGAAALQGSIAADGLSAVSGGGYVSLLANGHADFTGKTTLQGRTGVYAGSVGRGRLKADNANIKAVAGDVALVSGADMRLGNGAQRNSITGNGISTRSGGSLTVGNQTLNAGAGALAATAKQHLTLQNVQTASTQNTVIAAENGNAVLNGVTAESKRHLAVSSKNGRILQNHGQTTGNNLKAAGVLSVQSRLWNVADNSRMQGGAVNLKSDSDSVNLFPSSDVKTVSNPVLRTDAGLRDLDGDINIEAGMQVYLNHSKNMTADGDLNIKAKEKLTIYGAGGGGGNPSAQTSILSAKGNMHLTGGDIGISGAEVSAGKDLTVASTKGQVVVGAVRNTFDNYSSAERVTQIQSRLDNINKQINDITSSQEYKRYKELERIYGRPFRLVALEGAGGQQKREEYVRLKAIFEPKLQTLHNQKEPQEKLLAAIRSPGRGHEHKGSELTGSNVTLVSAQGINVSGSKITAANGRAVLQAAGLLPEPSAEAKGEGQLRSAINISGVFDTFEYGQSGSDNYAYALFNRPSEISGKTGVTVAAPNPSGDSRIILSASDLSSEAGRITLKSYGDQLYTAGQGELYTFDKRSYKTGKWYNRKHITEIKEHKNAKADPVRLTAAKGIEIKSGGSLHAYATVFDAPKGTADIQAGRELKLFAVDEVNYDKLESHKKRRFLGITYDRVHDTTTHAMQTALPARVVAESADLKSGWDTLLQGTEFETGLGGARIQAGVGEQARADAKIILQGIKTTVRNETVSNSKSAVWQKQAGRGSTVETLKLPSFSGPAAPILTAPGGYIADIPKGNLKTEIEKLAKQPEYAYLKQLQTAKNTNWKQIQLAYDKWDYKQEGLTPAGAAVVTLAVAVLTSGAGVGGTLGLNGASAAAADAAFASLASQASVSLINNKGDIGKTLKELGRSQTVKNTAVAAATAGVADKIGVSKLADISDKQWVNNLTVNLAEAGSAALIHTAVNGGSLKDNLEANILAALVKSAHGEAASKIKGLDQHYLAHKIAHAVAGCAAAAANKGKCQDGAIGAAVGEIVGEALTNGKTPAALTAKEREQILAYSKLVAGTVSGVAGGDVNTAANAAAIAVEKNVLNFASTPTNAKKHQPKQPDKSALEKLIQAIAPAHTAGAIANPQDKEAALWISKIRNGITGPIVITSYGVYAAGWGTPLIGSAGKAAISVCMVHRVGNPFDTLPARYRKTGQATRIYLSETFSDGLCFYIFGSY
ncbi:DUF637 domain-containing protein [Neisseria dentiae]|uniref:two-partner secretion domain-containing protein n=1 Tax=Neisseria dentiae TaxID=194197 RepID=UPI0035A1904A